MDAYELIERKKAERTRKGLHIRVEYENRTTFDRYCTDEAQRDRLLERFRAKIGKPDEVGIIAKAVYIVE